MTKLTSLLAALALAACSSNSDKPKDDPGATKPVPTTDEKARPEETKPAPTAAPAATGDLPADCTDYKAMIDKLAECQKLPQATRDGLKNAFAQSWTGWEKAADKAAISGECKTAADNLKTAAAAACGW